MTESLFAISATPLPEVWQIQPRQFEDLRGCFIKTMQTSAFHVLGLETQFSENFYSVSKKGVIRGMHFQIPDCDQAKLIYVPQGKIRDVILDIRVGSPTYGQHVCVEISETNRQMLYIPSGCAHGFGVLSEIATVVYLVTHLYSPQHEAGIRWDSFGAQWGIEQPILSERDQAFESWQRYQSPFTYGVHTK